MSKHFKTPEDAEMEAPAERSPETWHQQKARLEPPVEAWKPALVLEFSANPPPRMAISQEAWDATPDVIKSETCRMVRELTAGIAKHRPGSERFEELREFHDLAAKSGTTVAAAFHRYVAMENLLRTDPDKGIEAICKNLGIDPRDLATLYLADVKGCPAPLMRSVAQGVREGRIPKGTDVGVLLQGDAA